MDKALDEIVRERQSTKSRTSRRNPRGGVRKPRDNTRNTATYDESRLWVHDKFDDSEDTRRKPTAGRRGGQAGDQTSNHAGVPSGGARLKVENLHYELGEEELLGLFRRVGPVAKLHLLYDRAGRSEGVAFVTYENAGDAQRAIEEFDGANAHGQPITLTLVSRGGRAPPPSSGEAPRSLFDRIRTASPPETDRTKRDPTRKPTPPGIDRYVPPERRRQGPRERDDGRRQPRSSSAPGRSNRQIKTGNGGGAGHRPKKTVEELDAEMNDYFGAASEEQTPAAPAQAPVADEDVDMIL